uniref:Protein regulator of cytokinesis 1-like n=1 Tax=Gouania willdenowi TaxID=441366 RepID=A0A8C5N7E4_GOUWI
MGPRKVSPLLLYCIFASHSEVLAAESVACLHKALCRLKDIWEEIGIPEDQRLQRTNTVNTHIKNLLEMMIQEEEALKKKFLISIKTCSTQMETLCEELQMPVFQEEGGVSMLQQERNIRTRVEVLTKEKARRLQQLQVLLEQDQDLCDVLCCEPHGLNAPGNAPTVPSLQQLQELQQHVSNQQEERAKRHTEFVQLRQQIVRLMEEVEKVPENSFEKDVMCEEEDAFCLSSENLQALTLLLREIRSQVSAQCEVLKAQILQLWECLQVPEENRSAFSQHMLGSSCRTLKELQTELQRLQQLKLQNIRAVTLSLRAQINQMWDRCLISSEQRGEFGAYVSEDFTEDLLCEHEAELQRLQLLFEEHRQMFEGVQRWEEHWSLYLELERKASDPSRFTNRGGNLLREEKQRAELHKSLPKLEKQLKAQIEQWEQQQSREFLVNGKKFLQHVEQQWELHHVEKEKEKQERHMKRNKQTEEDMLYGTIVRTPTKRRFLPSSTTPRGSKRCNATGVSSSASNSTTRSVYGGTVCHSPVSRPPLSANKVSERTHTHTQTHTHTGVQ